MCLPTATIVQGNGILMLYRVFLQLRELLRTRNYFCVEPCQRQSFGAEAARGIGDRLVHAWCFKAFLIEIAHLLQYRVNYSDYNPLSVVLHQQIVHFEYPPPLEGVRLKAIDENVVVQFVIGKRSLVKALTLNRT